MAQPVKVSMTTFVDFVTASGTSRITKVAAARRSYEQPFTPAREYWLPLRQAIVRMHEEQLGIGSLQNSVRSQTDTKKIANYESRLKATNGSLAKRSTSGSLLRRHRGRTVLSRSVLALNLAL